MKRCECDKWTKDTKYDHCDGNEGKHSMRQLWSYCPFCGKKLKQRY